MPLACSTGTSSRPTNAINQRKFKIKAIVLLLILIPGVMLSSLKTINPWLSGCDISHPIEPEMPGSCSSGSPRQSHRKMLQPGGEFSCPKMCPLNQSTSSVPRCLPYLDDSRKNAICNFSTGTKREWLKSLLAQIRLRHCCEHKVLDSLSGPLLKKVLRGKGECFKVIDHLVNVDNLAARVSCEFNEVLSRFDCSHSYSVRFSCEHCKEAYRRWVCTSLVPFFNGTTRIRPCRSICQVVEQKCPYFLPENRAPWLPTQYAGEPVFLCTDPNIPESAEQQLRAIHPSEDSCCVKPCGVPYDGLCIQPGIGCVERFPYENVSRIDCTESDYNYGRGTADRCPGPSVHPGSTATLPAITSYPVLALSSFLTLQASHPHRHILLLLLPILLFLRSSFLGVLQLTAFFCFAPLPPITSLLEINACYHFIKIFQSILNYLKSICNTGQSYFIPVSINSRSRRIPVSGSSSPVSPPARERRYRVRSEYVRGHCKRHCIQISMSVQDVTRGNLCGLTEQDGNLFFECLVNGTLTNNESGIGIECNGSTINGMNAYIAVVPETIPLKSFRFNLSCESREVRTAFIERFMKMNCFLSYLNDGLLPVLINNSYVRMDVVYKVVLTFLHGLISYKYVNYLKNYNLDERCRKKKKRMWRRVPVWVKATGVPKFPLPISAIFKD